MERSGGDGAIRLDIFVPIKARDAIGPAAGVLLLRVDPADFLFPLIQTWPVSSASAETLLIRREGDEVVYLNDLRHRQGTALRLRFPVSDPDLPASRAARGESGQWTGVDYRGVPVLAAVRPIPQSPWFMVAKVDLAEIRAPLRRDALLLGAVVLMAILAAGFGLGWLERRARVELYQRSEAEIRRHHEILAGVLESTDALIFSLDRDFRYTSFNAGQAAAMKAIYGTDIKPGMWLFDAMTVAEDRRVARANLERVLRGETIAVESYSGDEGLSTAVLPDHPQPHPQPYRRSGWCRRPVLRHHGPQECGGGGPAAQPRLGAAGGRADGPAWRRPTRSSRPSATPSRTTCGRPCGSSTASARP